MDELIVLQKGEIETYTSTEYVFKEEERGI